MFIVFGLASSFLQNLPSPVLERVRPQWSRISPAKGFTRIYSKQGFVEFAKSVFKIMIVSIIMFFALRGDFYSLIDLMFSDPQVIFVRVVEIVKNDGRHPALDRAARRRGRLVDTTSLVQPAENDEA